MQTNFTGLGNVVVTNAAGLFRAVGGGAHYLAPGSLYRNSGTTNIDAALLNALGTKTTGTTLLDGARLVSEGSPAHLNHVVRSHVVQEQSTNWGGAGSRFFTVSANHPAAPEVRMRFTRVATAANTGSRLLSDLTTDPALRTLVLRDCQLTGSKLLISLYPYQGVTNLMSVALTNNLCHRVSFSLDQDTTLEQPRLAVHARNNLFFWGSIKVADYTGTGTWTARDNLFDHTSNLNYWESVLSSNNGYTGATALSGSSGGDVLSVVPDYLTGTLGNFYYPTTGTNLARLINAGSRSAAAAQLYHHTVKTNNVKEGVEAPSTVDIGLRQLCLSGVAGQLFSFAGDPVYWKEAR